MKSKTEIRNQHDKAYISCCRYHNSCLTNLLKQTSVALPENDPA